MTSAGRGIWGPILAVWLLATVLGFFFATQLFVTFSYGRRPIPWSNAILLATTDFYLWAAISPFIFLLGGRIRFRRRRWWIAALAHFPAAILVSLLHLLAYLWLAGLLVTQLHSPLTPTDLQRAFSTTKLHTNVATYWVILGAYYGLEYYRRYRDRELRASQLEAQLAQAHLQVLKMQLHPHFLFNTLHSISTLMHRDVLAADRMLSRLSDLLRLTLETSGVQEVPLQQELDFLGRYLEIETVRFPDRLRVNFAIEHETLDACVPNLLLQPLVENAIRHAVARRSIGGTIWIESRRSRSLLLLTISDDGPGLPPDMQEGLGLRNTRARLGQLYGAGHKFELRDRPGGGLAVSLELPFTTRCEGQP